MGLQGYIGIMETNMDIDVKLKTCTAPLSK